MNDLPNVEVDVAQNEFIPENGRTADAIVTVTATDTGGGASESAERAEVIIVDISASMGYHENRFASTLQAVCTAIDTLRDGVRFAVVAGSHKAAMIYPKTESLVPASDQTRIAAKQAVNGTEAYGGTAIGTWLTLAGRLFAGHGTAIPHAILLTDGYNQHETDEELDAALAQVTGAFVCDCRGVGTDWKVAELRKIADTLLGTVDIIHDPADLADDFRAMTQAAMAKSIADVALRVWTPQGARVRFVKQVIPIVADLTDRRTRRGPLTVDYPTGSWGAESRDYHISVELPPGQVGDEMLAARVTVVSGERSLAQGLVRVVWTADEALSTRINPQVAHYTGQAELAQVIQEGLEARRRGDHDTATARLARAVRLAADSGNDDATDLLRRVVDIEDPASGTVRLRTWVEDADEMALDTRSTKTVRVGRKTGNHE